MIILLENVRSSLNVGNIFRTAEAGGVEKILLVGYTPSPIDRHGRENTRLAKTALGAEKKIKWEQFKTTADAIAKYKDLKLVAVEQTERATDYRKFKNSDALFIFGNEVDGVDKETLESVETHIQLPMLGDKESLNVSIVVGIIIYSQLSI